MTTHDAAELHQLLVQKALLYHKTVEGEYGCPGETCPGVKRLVLLLEQWTTIVLALDLATAPSTWIGLMAGLAPAETDRTTTNSGDVGGPTSP